MKKIFCLAVMVIALFLVGCGGGKEILVVSRESGSGTRDAFDGMIKNSDGDSLAKKADGTVQDTSIFVKNMNIQKGTSEVITKVSSNENAIGYISLGSVNSTIKTIKVEGIEANSTTVLNGSYKLSRPFVIMTKKDQTLTPAAADFLKYLQSSTAQAIVTSNKYVEQLDSDMVEYVAGDTALSGTVCLRGSTSMETLMVKLIADYQAKGGTKVTGINFDVDCVSSSAGISATKGDTNGNVIGMSSSAIKSGDAPSFNYFSIALDAVAIIVNNDNIIESLTIKQLFDIYTGAIKKFSDLE